MKSLNFASPLVTINPGDEKSRGSEFANLVFEWFKDSAGFTNYTFSQGYRVYIGNPQKPHSFDVFGIENEGHATVAAECMDFSRRKASGDKNQIPYDEFAFLNEAALFLSMTDCNVKYLVIRKTVLKNGESLARCYYRIYGHILNRLNVKLAEYDDRNKSFSDI
jgi:hypothetical protein